MKLAFLPSTLLLLVSTADALRFKTKQVRPSQPSLDRRAISHFGVSRPAKALSKVKTLAAGASNSTLDLNTVRDLIYIANITLGGVDYPVQLDTGSSDLWVQGKQSPLPNTTQTTTTYNLTYGIGWAYGPVSYAAVEFADLSIPSQAYIDVSQAENPALSYGAMGILGLGFTSLSTVDALVNRTNSASGRSVLYNAFAAHPDELNFIAFSLERSADDGGGDVDGSFAIGEYEPKYAAVAKSTKLPTWPEHAPTRWNVLLESFVVGDTTVSLNTSVDGAPSNRAVVLLDSGTSYTYAPKYICDAIYGDVKGAAYDSTLGQWVVPCDAEVDMALQFAGEMYPIHPLDINPHSLSDSTSCVGSFVPQAVSLGAGQFDWLIGDNVLRSMYSVYDFGDFDANKKMGDPYVQLLSVVDPDKASAEFAKSRGTTARTGITYEPTPSDPSGTTTAGPNTVSLTADVAAILDRVSTFFPAIAAVLGLNALVLLTLVAAAVLLCCRRGRRTPTIPGARPRSTPGRSTPLPPMSAYYPAHEYAPVSVALSDDMVFQPPSPGRRYDSEVAKGAGRPDSAYSAAPIPTSPSRARGASSSSTTPLTDPFQRPAPAFSNDRPMSLA